MKIDHLQLVLSREYAEVIADRLAALPRGRSSLMTVIHENDDSCCRREPWPVSCTRLLETVYRRRSVKSVLVALKSDPEANP